MKGILKTVVVSLFVSGVINVSAGNLLTDNNFSKESGWSFYVNESVTKAGGSGFIQDGKATVKSPAIEKQSAACIQLIKPLDIEKEKSYKLKFKANADKAGTLSVSYCLSKAPWAKYGSASVDLVPGEKDYEIILDVKANAGNFDTPRSLRMLFGNLKDVTVSVSDVSFEEMK